MVNIIKGHVNQMLNKENKLSEARLSICNECPLLLKGKLWICNPKLWINRKGRVVTKTNSKKEKVGLERAGFVLGCGCNLKAKTTLKNSTCPIDKW